MARHRRYKQKRIIKKMAVPISLLILLGLGSYYQKDLQEALRPVFEPTLQKSYAISDIPEYFGEPYVILNDNQPQFKEEEKTLNALENYSNLDSLGRCGPAFANLSKELMPQEERGSIGMVKPSGWHTIKYDIVDGKYLYNRCHLIGYQLTGENANAKNLITCTREMNTKSQLPFENEVANYIKETNHHVLYRVTPYFKGTNLLASGVQMEAYSIEDQGEGISFNVFVYNVQQGIEIDYKTGESKLKES